ncbi:Uncharacterized protein OBRU01_07177 [Operophtera brumata]|uniref:Uncharacterized protein n=1 Tax=Operophtera brumata TaxID=104452 RepID=A0A0L7LJX9_OPEBR|nr:Uncharacterized protein OBRU01_07177 [Operophtera brumata]
MANTSCQYYTNRTLGWMMNNKVIVFLSALSFCLLISTWSMAAQRNRAYTTIDELNAQLATTPAPVAVPTTPTEDGSTTEIEDSNTTILPEETTMPEGTTIPEDTTTPVPDNDDQLEETNENIESIVAKSKLLSLLAA